MGMHCAVGAVALCLVLAADDGEGVHDVGHGVARGREAGLEPRQVCRRLAVCRAPGAALLGRYQIAFVRCNGNRCNGTAYGSLQGGEACLYLAVRSVHRRRIGRWLGGASRAHAEHSTLAIIAPHRSQWSRIALTPVAEVSGHQTQGRAPLLGSLNPEGSGVMHQPQAIH